MVSQPDSLSASSEDAAARAGVLDALDADDALDAQATQQLPAADRTVTDLPALDGEAREAVAVAAVVAVVTAPIPEDRPSSTLQDHPAMHDDEPSVIITPEASARTSHAADATGEIGIEDIVEVAEALARKQAAAATAAAIPSRPPVPSRPPMPSRPPTPASRPPVLSRPAIQTKSARAPSIPPPVPSRRSAVPRSELSEVFGAITPKKLQELADAGLLAAPPVPADLMPTSPPPAMMHAHALQMHVPPPQLEESVPLDLRHSSIAPFAVDMTPVPARRPSLIVESTAELARAAGMPSHARWQTIAGIAGAIALSTIALGLVGYGVTHRVKTRTATVVVDSSEARRPSLEQQRAAAIPPPSTVADDQGNQAPKADGAKADTSNADALKPNETQVTLTPEPIAATFVPAPPPRRVGAAIAKPVAQPTVKAAAPASQPSQPSPATAKSAATPQGTGTLRVPTSAVLIDGAPKKVVNGAVTVSCGKHVVKAPMRGSKTIDVPCGGTASF